MLYQQDRHRRTEDMTPRQRLAFHTQMPDRPWCHGCWWEYHIRIKAPCGWHQASARSLGTPP